MNDKPKAPRAFILKDDKQRRPVVEFDSDETQTKVVATQLPVPASRAMPWGSILLTALVALFTMAAGLAVGNLIDDFFTRSPLLGWTALTLAGIAGLAAMAIAFREIWGLMRLRHIGDLQAEAARAINLDDAPATRAAIDGLIHLYRNRRDISWGLSSLASHEPEIMDARDRLRLAERYLLAPLDAQSHRIIARAARRVTLLTAMTPAAALDILFVAALNLRMLRELAGLYGGRPATLSTLKLARLVVAHLAITGGLALSDNFIQHLLGRGLVGRFSARFGEGAVNGILTARIGLAARDVCRPIPQDASARESLASLLRELVTLNEGPRSDGREGRTRS
jgi:putative membrane protein